MALETLDIPPPLPASNFADSDIFVTFVFKILHMVIFMSPFDNFPVIKQQNLYCEENFCDFDVDVRVWRDPSTRD